MLHISRRPYVPGPNRLIGPHDFSLSGVGTVVLCTRKFDNAVNAQLGPNQGQTRQMAKCRRRRVKLSKSLKTEV